VNNESVSHINKTDEEFIDIAGTQNKLKRELMRWRQMYKEEVLQGLERERFVSFWLLCASMIYCVISGTFLLPRIAQEYEMYKETLHKASDSMRGGGGGGGGIIRDQSPKTSKLRRGSSMKGGGMERKRLSQRYIGVPSLHPDPMMKKGHALLTSPFLEFANHRRRPHQINEAEEMQV
jgi:hypothetical protein